MKQLWLRLQVLFHHQKFHSELEEEMSFHREMQRKAGLERGLSGAEAERQAAIEFGNTTLLTETSREAWGWGPLERVFQDVRYAGRMLRKSPGFTAVVVLVLALGIGANTAMFSAMHALLWNPFPFPHADRIVFVDARHVSGRNSGTGWRDFLDWRAQNVVFEEMAITPWTGSVTLTRQGEPRRAVAAWATDGFGRVLGIQPALGRLFSAEDTKPGAPRVVVVGYALWQRQYGARQDVLGRTVTLDGLSHTIIGVLPEHFALPGIQTCEFWLPLGEDPAADRFQHQFGVVARMKPGISLKRAQADMTAIAHRLEQAYPATNTGWGVAVKPLRSIILDMGAKPILVMSCTVLFVLALACANVAGLLLARGSARAREMSIRASLGAGRWRIMRQVLTESVLLALAGGTLGVLVASWLMAVMRVASPPDLALDAVLRLDWRVLVAALGLSLATGLAFGMFPAWYASAVDLAGTLKGGSARTPGQSRNRVLSVIVSGEAALSLILLVVASLLAKDLAVLIRTNIGIRIEHVLTFALDPPQSKYGGGAEYHEVLRGSTGEAARLARCGGSGRRLSVAHDGLL